MSKHMKDSGIAWVNKIPSDWDIHPLYYYFAERNRPNRRGKENNLLSLSYGKIIKKDINICEGLLPASYNSYNIIDPLDIVLRLTDLQNDKRSLRTGLSHERGIITSAYVTLKPSNRVCPAFFHYLLHAYDVEKVLYNMGNGVRQSLNYAELSKLPLLEPSLQEQQRIADYLDKKCAEIDTLSNSIQQQIDTLEQYKRAVITETVTKGLNPSVPMKDSGIPWIGQIPAHWSTIKIKFLASFYNGYAFDSESLTDEGDGTVIRIGDICEGSIKPETALKYNGPTLTLKPYQIEKGDILIALSGATVGKTGYITKDYPNAFINQRVGIIRSTNSRFLNHALQTSSFIPFALLHAAASAQPNISLDTIGNYTIAFPNNSREQQAIAEYLDKKCAKIDGIIQAKQQQLEKLEQYKKAIIFEYVTGKKQVPEA